jgi:hypothetical protein
MNRMFRRLAALVLVALLARLPSSSGAARPGVTDFDRDVAPLLARRCLDCHSGSEPKGGLDLSRRKAALAAVVRGKPDDSLLWQRVRDAEMPPKKPLPEAERAVLRAWIAAGAPWGADPIDPFRVTTATRAGYDWWALQSPGRQAVPAVRGALLASNPIDRFLLARLQARGLSFSPEADRRTLIRRLHFDLIGLPPTPEEVDRFVADARPDAYERLVDALLASPAFGERWARHWLDVARFGESDGFERDLPRPAAWPYRDWVINALNRDLPYDEFARLQLAGDALRPDDPEAVTATGFLVAGPHDIVIPVGEVMRATMRQDELEDITATVGQTFLGLTVHCARCHDHKFDPISQKDYYRLAAALAGVAHSERPLPSPAAKAIPPLAARVERLRRELDAIEEPVRRRLLAAMHRAKVVGPRPIAEWDFGVGLEDRVGKLHAKLHGGARQGRDGLVLDGRSAFAATPPLAKDLTAKTLEVWVRLDGLAQRGGAAMSVQTPDGRFFDAVVFGEREPGRWMAGSDNFTRTQSFGGTAEKEAEKKVTHIAITWDEEGAVAAFRDGRPYGMAYTVTDPFTFRAKGAQVVFGLRHAPAGGNRLLSGVIRRARLYDRALLPAEVAASAGAPQVPPEEVLPELSAADRERHGKLTAEREALEERIARLGKESGRKVYAALSVQPAPIAHLLIRGSVTAKREVVAPEVPAALAGRLPPTGQKPDAPELQRRLALARWITHTDNPLFARVIVNRLWQHHFGTGIVVTPNDFGFNGGRPSHPELLDFLAGELIRGGWSLKKLHRLMVLSAAYRQSSRQRPEAAKVDADNRLLWRKAPLRLEAEAVRDAVLAISGQLDRRMGGPSYLDFRTYFFSGTQFYDPIDQVGPAFTRRSLYRMGARGGRNPFLDTFDCPDPSTTTPRRAVTTTPLQALTLFNNAMVLHAAEQFAVRLRREAGEEAATQVRRAFRLAFGRAPEERELALVVPFVHRHGLEAFCRVLLNSNEMVQVD